MICDSRFESQIAIAVKSRDLEHLGTGGISDSLGAARVQIASLSHRSISKMPADIARHRATQANTAAFPRELLARPSAEMCRGFLLHKFWRILFWALFPTEMRRKNPATKSAQKSVGQKMKIREKSVLPKPDPKNFCVCVFFFFCD